MMGRMGFGSAGEMIFLFVLALIVLGPKRLPELARQLGKFMNEFRRASNEFKYQIESEINTLELQEKRAKQQILPPAQASAPPNPVPPTADSQAAAPPVGTIASGTLREDKANSAISENSSHSAPTESATSEPAASSARPESGSAKGSDA